jgi:hypothetical protein
MRRGLRNSDQKPNRYRSSVERLGARRRERLITRSCCFMSRLSATMTRAPPGPGSLANVVKGCVRSISRSFMVEQSREGYAQEQDCLVLFFRTPSRRLSMIALLPMERLHCKHFSTRTDGVLLWQISWSETSINASLMHSNSTRSNAQGGAG